MQSKIIDVTYEIDALDLSEFEFDWTIRSSPKCAIYAANVDEKLAGLVEFEHFSEDSHNFMYLIEVTPEYRGTKVAGELLAFVGQDSLKQGFDGFVVWESKTIYYKYYMRKYGAKPISGRRLYFDEEATKKLIRIYIEDNYTIDDIVKPINIIAEKKEDNYHIPPEEYERHQRIIAEGEKLIRKHGHGFVPSTDHRSTTGFRYRLAIEDEIGRTIPDNEWYSMSIR